MRSSSMNVNNSLPFSTLALLLLFFFFSASIATDTITPEAPLEDGQTLVSAGGAFELGFFTPSNSSGKYLGIWYKTIPLQTVVWIANRATPLAANSTAALKLLAGSLVLVDKASNTSFWSSSNSSNGSAAQLLDYGNLVLLSEENKDGFLWESFDYPSDTLLPGMKLGWDLRAGLDRYLNAWKSPTDPSVGDYTFKMDPRGSPEIFLYHDGQVVYRSGPWNGVQFSGVPDLVSNDILVFSFVSNQDAVYYTYRYNNDSTGTVSRFTLTPAGQLRRFVWLNQEQGWTVFWSDPKDQCDSYGACGAYGACNSDNSPACSCLPGFEPKSPAEWALRDGSSGCVRNASLNCSADGFWMVGGVKLPDSSNATVNESLSLGECKDLCLSNCGCTAYASANISGGESGCIIWTGDLLDIRQFEDGGQDLYYRLAVSEIRQLNVSSTRENSKKRKGVIIIIVPTICALLLCGIAACCIWKRKLKNHKNTELFLTSNQWSSKRLNVIISAKDHHSDEEDSRDLELPLFHFSTIAAATDYFAVSNKLGEGGFGPVYKGTFKDGQDIAVKRLSANSSQGIEEFKNEVKLIAKLQHRNLVQLLGCCIHGEERMLIYQFMHNRSLDTFIFDKMNRTQLNWQRRFTIIVSIARGLLYLHQDSRLKIIHRDLKASNILLDKEMNPKISDFGMARIFGGDQIDARTHRVVGTYGYMSPEYAMDGIFSVKSDVFSFGVLILEIVSGKRNRGVYHSEPDINLLSKAWELWKENKALELIDESMDSYNHSEVMSCIQVGLLCVQEQAIDRPTISEVIMMLGGNNVNLPQPNVPGFSILRGLADRVSVSTTSMTANGLTITMLGGR